MKRKFSFFLLFLALILAPLSSAQAEVSEGWQTVVEGIDYREYYLPDPNRVYVARLDRSNPNLTLETALGQGRLTIDGQANFETVSGMADRYNESLNYWGESWGKRSRVVIAINGSFVDENTLMPDRGQVLGGWYSKRFSDHENGSGFAWKLDGSAFIGGCVTHPADKQRLTFADSSYITFDGINTPHDSDDLILYTSQYGPYTPVTDDPPLKLLQVVLRLNRPMLVTPAADPVIGEVVNIETGAGGISVLFDQVVLSAEGEARAGIQGLAEGDKVAISQNIRNCGGGGVEWTKTYASLGGSFDYLLDGEIMTFDDPGANVHNPRTAIAFNDQYIFFIVVDGRDPSYSVGMTMQELGEFSRDVLGATWGINQDGGGSATMAVNGEVKNNTYCNNVVCQGRIFIPMIVNSSGVPSNRPENSPTPYSSLSIPPRDDPSLIESRLKPTDVVTQTEEASSEPTSVPLPPIEKLSSLILANQRAVTNGMMMAVVEATVQSNTLAAGQAVQIAESANIRSGPGTNYPVLITLPIETTGVVLDHPNGLNGIQATGHSWWLVEFRDNEGKLIVTGWVSEALLTAGAE